MAEPQSVVFVAYASISINSADKENYSYLFNSHELESFLSKTSNSVAGRIAAKYAVRKLLEKIKDAPNRIDHFTIDSGTNGDPILIACNQRCKDFLHEYNILVSISHTSEFAYGIATAQRRSCV